MLLYITRKYPPSIGGMQRFNQKLVFHLKRLRDFYLISWGHSQACMPLFLAFAFLKTIFLGVRGRIGLIYLADGLMSPLGLTLKKLLRLPVAVSIHGRDIAFDFPGYLKAVSGALKKMDAVICVSRQLKQECLKLGVPEKILRVIPNGVNRADFEWKEAMAPGEYLSLDLRGRTVLISVGRLVPKKGVDRFVEEILPEVVRKAPQVLYLVVGDGPLREKIEKLIRVNCLEKNVLLLGDVPMEDKRLIALYNCADIFVMPNVLVPGDIEGFGIVALEAGAAGLPAVASRLQGIQEAIADGRNGILLPWDDRQAFIRTLLDLISCPEKRKKMGEDARRFVEDNYSWDRIARRYHEAFEEIESEAKIAPRRTTV